MTRSKASLLLLALTGCLHRSPDAAVLAPLVPYLPQEALNQTNQPEYVVFANQLTASVFESLKRNARYRITPPGTRFVCPSNPEPKPVCYVLAAKVIKLMGDTAIASIERTYRTVDSEPEQIVVGGTLVYSDTFLLSRQNGNWRVEKRITGSLISM